MYIFQEITTLKAHLQKIREQGQTIGFVPTMGALHEGHLSLIEQAKQHSDVVVCSIFVNPTQFENPEDLKKYPNALEDDTEMLIKIENDVLFTPNVEVMYPEGVEREKPYDFGWVASTLEGSHRPGHFDGMAQVVKRLLEIVEPDKLFMGQKDFQQQLIVRNLIEFMGIPTELHRCPIIREENGLAMSSRNRRLNDYEIAEATQISKALFRIKRLISEQTIADLKSEAIANMERNKLLKVEYLEIVDAKTLKAVERYEKGMELLVCTAAYLGPVRLIDNVLIG